MKKINFFNRHLIESEENYFEHFLFNFVTSMWLIFSGTILFIHSIVPFIFVANTSKQVKKINELMQKRRSLMKEPVVEKTGE
jgi:uncharacterized membrane protein